MTPSLPPSSPVRPGASLLHAPLFQMALLGLLLYGLHAWVVGSAAPVAQTTDRIDVDADEIGALAEAWERKRGRPPTRAELEDLVQSRVREEILSREALAMGMDKGDPMIRRLLAQKVGFLIENITDLRTPTDEELTAFRAEDPQRFRRPGRVAFRQRFFHPEKHGERLEEVVQAALKSLRAATEDADALGDTSMLPEEIGLESEDQIARVFGETFAAGVMALDGSGWQGPVRSTYGVHLVEVRDREAGAEQPLEQIRDEVLTAWRDAERLRATRSLYEKLQERYEVRIDEASLLRTAAEGGSQGR